MSCYIKDNGSCFWGKKKIMEENEVSNLLSVLNNIVQLYAKNVNYFPSIPLPSYCCHRPFGFVESGFRKPFIGPRH